MLDFSKNEVKIFTLNIPKMKGGIRQMEDFIEEFQKSLHENLFKRTFQEIASIGAEWMLRLALEAEINEFLEKHRSQFTPDGRCRIVRNGYHVERKIQTGVGEVSVKVPRSRDLLKTQIEKIVEMNRLRHERQLMVTEIASNFTFDDNICHSKQMEEVCQRAKILATTGNTVLVQGETVVGKDILAHSMHKYSSR